MKSRVSLKYFVRNCRDFFAKYTKLMNMIVAFTNQLPIKKETLVNELKQAYPNKNSWFLLLSIANFLEKK